jgi:hypothetical protein
MRRALKCLVRFCVILLGAIVFKEATALACGVPPPGSPPGFRCGDTSEAAAPKLRTYASYTRSETRIVFTGDRKADVERSIAGIGLEYPVDPKVSIQLSLGVLTTGTMNFLDSVHRFASGASGSLSMSYRVLEEKDALPFIGLTGTFGYANAKTNEPRSATVSYHALDARLGVYAGKSFADVFAVYGAARVFGGPIFWKLRNEAVLGTDLYKYQLGLGASVALFKRVDLFGEWIALGERSLSFGAGLSY